MGYISVLLVLLLQTLNIMNSNAAASCGEYSYATSNQTWCAMRDPVACQVTIDAINSESECDKQNVNQPCKSECDEQKANHPCKLRTTTKLLTHVTSADAAIGLWIVVLYTVMCSGEAIHCLKACSQCFYWSALILIMADLAASTWATLLTEVLNTQAKCLEEAGCLSLVNETFASLNSIRRDGQTLSYIGFLKIVLNVLFTISFVTELVSEVSEWCRYVRKGGEHDRTRFAVNGHIFRKRSSRDRWELFPAMSKRCRGRCCEERCDLKDACAKCVNWLLIVCAASIAFIEHFLARDMLTDVNDIFLDAQKETGETSWCVHCPSASADQLKLENKYRANGKKNNNTIIYIFLVVFAMFFLHFIVSACACVTRLKLACDQLAKPFEDTGGANAGDVELTTHTRTTSLQVKPPPSPPRNRTPRPKPMLRRATECLHDEETPRSPEDFSPPDTDIPLFAHNESIQDMMMRPGLFRQSSLDM